MADGCADRLSSAGGVAWPAHWPAFLVSTRVGVKAVIVHPTLNLDTSHIWVAFVAVLTSTHGLVFYHSAEGVVSAGTRVLADPVDAGVRLPALIVSAAPGQDGRQGSAAVFISADIAVRTCAHHSPHRQGVNHCADGGVVAGVEGETEGLTLLTEAAVAAGAVLVLHALWSGQRDAGHIGVTGEPDGAATLGLMGSHQTLSILGTWVLMDAGVDAVLASAGPIFRALLVSPAADHLTGYKWIPLVAGDALAHGPVPGWVALGKPSTGVLDETGVDTVAVNTGLLVPALIVTLAANWFTGNLGVANETRWTDTDGSMVLNKARCAGPTVTWVNTLPVDTCCTVGAVIIPSTARGVGELHRLALGAGVRHPTLPTGTDHRPEGKAVDNCADGRDVTRREGNTRILTSLVQTGSVVRTVTIHIALWWRLGHIWGVLGFAGHQGVAHPPRRTLALGVVVLNRTCG